MENPDEESKSKTDKYDFVVKPILDNLKRMREDVVLVVGANGAGKTHMIQTLSIVEKFKDASDDAGLREELEASFPEDADVTFADMFRVPYHAHELVFNSTRSLVWAATFTP